MSGERAHALLSASSAKMWLACPPSARINAELPDKTSDDAEAGTLAHAICELKLKQLYIRPQSKTTFRKKLKALQEQTHYQKEMDGYTDDYIDYIAKLVHEFDAEPYIQAEKRVDYSHIAPEGFGTADCILIGGGQLHIVDFKYGKGVPVSAEANPQLKLYALGALQACQMLYPIETVVLHIVQPRIQNDNASKLPVEELRQWGEMIKPWAQQAYQGEGEFRATDEGCKWCKIRATCRARADKHLELAKEEFRKPPELSAEEVGAILKQAKDLKTWAADLETWTLKELLKGGSVPGWKAVEGRKDRAFVDQEEAFSYLQAHGLAEEAMLYERKPLSLTAVEKLLGKKDFAAAMEGRIIRKPGKPTLAPESDKREAITLQTSAAEDFKEEQR